MKVERETSDFDVFGVITALRLLCSCLSSWMVYWECSVLMWRRPTELQFNKTSNCWRRSCRLSVRALNEGYFEFSSKLLISFVFIKYNYKFSPSRGRSHLSAPEGGVADGAVVQPATVVSGGNGESSRRTARQRPAHPGCDGGDAAPQTEVPSSFFLFLSSRINQKLI